MGLAVNFEIILTEITSSAGQISMQGLPPFLVIFTTLLRDSRLALEKVPQLKAASLEVCLKCTYQDAISACVSIALKETSKR